MTRRFKPYTIEEFESLIDKLSIKRKINHIQIHHTWKPRKSDYKGESTILGMWRYHTETKKWQDIAQHFSPAPDGLLWDGRSLELDPAGITNHNKGGIMFEMIGDFDIGQEQLEGKQLYAITRAVAVLLKKFNLGYDAIVFHREYAPKTCPGTGINKEWFIETVKRSGVKMSNERDINGVPDWAAKDWEEAVANGYFDGTRPGDNVTRAELACVVNKIRRNFKPLIEQNKKNIDELATKIK
ncbi:peptidoglycan recognition protein family protein [Schinkia azotoformans]|uniref:peptidoglycan recognition protein family protein n=1 Tax=Schinkia azotoformans TaxID=1454 RepID=UPI002DBCBD4C|nr:peptidoglycan recognition family protein [Schinkia azotoformans]MEC1714773.1 peptidoglycan recognition family protein [Schinkia azotoformans]MEC1757471.1 peptidoglycan recognition family protein [Schinkia azotoformans]